MAYSTRLAMLRKTIAENPDCHVLVCERSLEADRNIFAKMLFADGMMEHVHHEVYQRLYHDTSLEFQMDAVVYLDVDPTKCMERVKLRNRGGENNISLEYLAKCHTYYEDWMQRLAEERTPMLQLNTNADVRYEPGDKGTEWVDEIYRFVGKFVQIGVELGVHM
jgi:deoxyadenosine/deoxycytidine kinase